MLCRSGGNAKEVLARAGLVCGVDYTSWVLDAYTSACDDGSVDAARWLVQRFAPPRADCDLVTQIRAEKIQKSLGAVWLAAHDPRATNLRAWKAQN